MSSTRTTLVELDGPGPVLRVKESPDHIWKKLQGDPVWIRLKDVDDDTDIVVGPASIRLVRLAL